MTGGTRNGHEWSPRQKQVLDLLARGRTNGQIAEALGITLDGAKWHVSEIIGKLDLDTREEAAEYWRQRQGFRARLRLLTRTGSAPALLRWLGIGGAATAAVVVVAVVGFMLLNDGGDDEDPAVPDASPTTAVTATTETPGRATATPGGGSGIVELAPGMPAEVPGAILYYDVNLPSDAPGSDDRAYVDRDGQLVEETLRVWLEDALDGEVRVLNITVTQSARSLIARVCREPCLYDGRLPRDDADIAWLLSTDGGVTWERLGGRFDELTPSTGAWVVGVLSDGQVVVEQQQGPEFWVYPSGESFQPPHANATPMVTAAGELLWQGRDSFDTTTVRYWDSAGVRVFPLENVDSPRARADAGATFHIVHIDGKDQAYFLSVSDAVSELRVVTRSGEVLEAWRWPGMMTATGGTDEGTLVGIVHAPGDDDQERLDRMPRVWEEGPGYPWRLALIDLVAGEIRPIAGLQPLGLAPGGRLDGLDPGVQALLIVGLLELVSGEAVLRVAAGGSCLNVRAEPSTSAESLRCYADGVLLLERDADAPDGWVAVTTPDGRDGWASAEFLER